MADNLQTAVELLKSGKKAEARTIFGRLVQADANNEQAWLSLSACVTDEGQKRDCLKRVLGINPSNKTAEKALADLDIASVLRTSQPTTPAEVVERPQGVPGRQVSAAAPTSPDSTMVSAPPIRGGL